MKKVLAVLVFLIIGIVISLVMINEIQSEIPLQILTPCDVNPDLYDSDLKGKCLGHKIKTFNLIDQLGNPVSEKLIENKIVVADFFFVSCRSICPIMTKQLERVNRQYKYNNNVIILSHTVWPEQDSPEILLSYANEHHAKYDTWRFLTGDKKEIYRLARQEYLVAPQINDPNYNHGGSADFVHTENLVLIDQKQRIRGFYNGTDSLEVTKLITDIAKLKKD